MQTSVQRPSSAQSLLRHVGHAARELLERRGWFYLLSLSTLSLAVFYAVILVEAQTMPASTGSAAPTPSSHQQTNLLQEETMPETIDPTPPTTNDTTVTVNGQSIPADDNGDVHTTVPLAHGSASIDISNNAISGSNSSTNLRIRSHSSTHQEVDATE